MNVADAAKILDLPADATPEQLEARFNELRRKLEDKIAKAPTPGLQAKYRESLTEITTAFESLILAADSSTLPVTQKSGSPVAGVAGPDRTRPPAPTPGSATPATGKRAKSGGKEFLVVAVIAVLLLGAGGWFVMKTRADNAEASRVATEAAAKKQADEQAEIARVNSLKTSLRTKLAEARVDWEAHESSLQDAERRTNELKSELRGLRDAAPEKKAELSAQLTSQELFTAWLKTHLLRHPAKVARARAEELLQSGAYDEAAEVVREITDALAKLPEDIEYRQEHLFKTTMSVRLHSKPEGVRWILTDTYGRTQEGKTPAQVSGLPLTHVARDGVPVAPFETEKRGEFTQGKITVRFLREGWPEVVKTDTAWSDRNDIIEAEFPEGSVAVSSLPSGVPFTITQMDPVHGWAVSGTTPATIKSVPVGRVLVRLSRPGFRDVTWAVDVEAGQTKRTPDLDQRAQTVNIQVAERPARITVDGKASNGQTLELSTLPPGEHTLLLETNGYKAYRTKFTTEQKATTVSLNYSFKQLAVENITCKTCSGAGQINQQQTCTSCQGKGRVDCPNCTNGITGYAPDGRWYTCKDCSAKGTLPCESCVNGVYRWQSLCSTCNGDGKVSKLQLSP